MGGIDHLVYGTPDLEAGIEHIERLLGVRAELGGRHPSWGTRNALIALGQSSYLEIVGPDPEQPGPPEGRPFGIDQLWSPRLTTWAATCSDLDQIVQRAGRNGVDLGSVQSGSRHRPDGVLLAWRLTDPHRSRFAGIVPFFIDWGSSPHPAAELPQRCSLIGLRAEHPQAEELQAALTDLGLAMRVSAAASPKLIAAVLSPRGSVEL